MTNSGMGIRAEDQARIFERYEQAVCEQKFGGFGVGLWIAREIVIALGGTIAVESQPERGATFTVELPRSGPSRRAAESQPAAGGGPESPERRVRPPA